MSGTTVTRQKTWKSVVGSVGRIRKNGGDILVDRL
jgi:hypothetical protein